MVARACGTGWWHRKERGEWLQVQSKDGEEDWMQLSKWMGGIRLKGEIQLSCVPGTHLTSMYLRSTFCLLGGGFSSVVRNALNLCLMMKMLSLWSSFFSLSFSSYTVALCTCSSAPRTAGWLMVICPSCSCPTLPSVQTLLSDQTSPSGALAFSHLRQMLRSTEDQRLQSQ